MSDGPNYLRKSIIVIFLLFFFLLLLNGCDEQYMEKFEDYHPWWLENSQQTDEVNDALVDISED